MLDTCPICGEATLYRYFSLMKVQPRLLRDVMYQGPGSYWEWCATCHSFEHMSGYVPMWWSFEFAGIDPSKLTAIPDVINAALHQSINDTSDQ